MTTYTLVILISFCTAPPTAVKPEIGYMYNLTKENCEMMADTINKRECTVAVCMSDEVISLYKKGDQSNGQ